MADHEFFGTVSASSAATAADHLMRKSEVDTQSSADRARANHTGTQTMSTISDAETYVDGRITTVLELASTPSTLNTLNELAAALGDDPNFATTIAGQIASLDSRLDTLEAAGGTASFKQLIGNGTLTVFTVTHNLGTRDVDVIVQRVSDWQIVYPVVIAATTNTVTVDFTAVVPTTDSYRVIVTAH